MELALVGTIVAIIAIVVLSRHRQKSTWTDNMQRLHPGVSGKAEWMASEDVVRRVERDYTAAQRWMTEVLLSGYTRYIREAPHYLTGNFLKTQQRQAIIQMRKDGPRIIGVLRSHHYVRVRY